MESVENIEQGAEVQQQEGQPSVEKAQGGAEEQAVQEQTPTERSIEDILSEHNISLNELKEYKEAKQKKLIEENRPIIEQQEWAEAVAFGIKEKLISKDDIEAQVKLSEKDDISLVFENYAKNYKNTDNLEGEDLDAMIRASFEDEYNLILDDSSSIKPRIAKILKSEADELRKPLVDKISGTKAEYAKRKLLSEMSSTHKDIFKEIASSKLEVEVNVNGDNLIVPIENTLTEEELVQSLKSEEGAPMLNYLFELYSKDKDLSNELYRSIAQNFALAKSQKDALAKAVWDKAEEHFKEVYSVGSRAPFDSKNEMRKSGEQVKTSEADFYRRQRA